ncbi:MAG TPA: PepSY domain-containing protein [Dehalococcoidia bacterium]|jgi:uncharacterized membrane protein YkoI|nr:PepSY domain-containing protein [Dehalococcoidia bacterium]
MTLSKRLYLLTGLVAVIALAFAALTFVATNGFADRTPFDDNGPAANAGKLDDGKDLLPQAGITLDQAVAAAQGAYSGNVGEIDLEYHDGKLVFNVDVGDQDVKVDAATGEVLGAGSD